MLDILILFAVSYVDKSCAFIILVNMLYSWNWNLLDDFPYFSYRFSWDRIQHLCQLRRHYVQLYAAMLQQSSNASTSELREMEKDLDSKVILLWRYTELVYWLLKKNCLLMLQIFSIAHFI
jgi:hypothetical protein